MIDENNILSLFYNDICSYFLGCCGPGKCSLVRKHERKLDTSGDFSVILNYDAYQNHIKFGATNNELVPVSPGQKEECEELVSYFADVMKVDPLSSQKIIQKLTQLSRNWSLTINKCHIAHGRMRLFLDKSRTFQNLLPYILAQGTLYGKSGIQKKEVLVSVDQEQGDELLMNMTDYRVRLIEKVIKSLLIQLGFTVSKERSSANKQHYYISSKYICGDSSNSISIHCGAVIDDKKKYKERETNLKDYLRQRCRELRTMSRHKYGEKVDGESWDDYFQKIGKATVQIDLLSVRPARTVTLNFQECLESTRNGSFILYNCARITSVQEQFEKKCLENIYPPLVPVEEVDFTLLVKEDEWELLMSYLLMYPHVLQSTLEHLDKGNPTPNLLCSFLSSLCACYSSYYRRVRILTEPREHLLPVMFARIYLMKAIEVVLHNGLKLLDIVPVKNM